MSQQIGDALIDAKEKAEQIIFQANVRAKGIVRNVTSEMESFSGQMAYLKEDVARVREHLAQAVAQMEEKLNVLDGMIDKASARLTLTTANVEPEALDSKEETAQPEEKDSFFREAAAGH